MPSPFPGMNPYLESPLIWPDVHNRLIVTLCDQLQPQLTPRCYAAIVPYNGDPDARVHARPRLIVALPGMGSQHPDRPARRSSVDVVDMPQQYRHIAIRTTEGDTLITMIKVLSPANKRAGYDHAEAYNRTRRSVFSSTAHLLEIDLLRAGVRPEFSTPLPDAPYFIFLSRAPERPRVRVWPLTLRDTLPTVPVPLLPDDADVALDLQAALARIYESARYDLRVEYRADPPSPALAAADAAWLDGLLRDQGLRVA